MDRLALVIPEISTAQKNIRIRVAGIDLGTTNSTTAEILWSPETVGLIKTRCLEFPQKIAGGQWVRSTLVPSVVAIHHDEVYIGLGAKQLLSRSQALGLLRNKNIFYECKNDIGIRTTYDQAPEGFRSAADIGGKVLGFLYSTVKTQSPVEIARTVVTVPASFQVSQRKDTLKAARLAGLDLDDGDLLDEPIAAFLDYLILHRDGLGSLPGRAMNLLVFDFGGGTCDVAIFRVCLESLTAPVSVSPLAVSRYHRLGGGDIDRAIVHEVLIPQLMNVNTLGPFDLTYDDKKNCLEPALLGIAEDLKVDLCSRLAGQIEKGEMPEKSRAMPDSGKPGIFTFNVRDMQLAINCPSLSLAQFDALLTPFLDEDLLYARETEYRMVCSVAAPLQDALDRSRLEPAQVDCCLLLGGSSRIPQVARAVQRFLPNAKLLNYSDPAELQTAVARGAAFHALTLELFGRGLVQPVCYDSIALRTETGTIELVPRGAALPYPGGRKRKTLNALAVPKTSIAVPLELKVEIVAGREQRCLYRASWLIPPPVSKGDPLRLTYRYDVNQVLDIQLMLEDTQECFSITIENPLTHVVSPQKAMVRVLELEEQLRTETLDADEAAAVMTELAENYADLGQKEKAIDILKKTLNESGAADAGILNQLGIYCKDIGDTARAEKFYREAAKASTWTGPLFNLALMLKRCARHGEAVTVIDEALAREPEGAYFVLRAQLAADTGSPDDRDTFFIRAFETFGPLDSLSDWALGWYLTGTETLRDTAKIDSAKAEQKRRRENKEPGLCPGSVLPSCRQGMQLRMQFL